MLNPENIQIIKNCCWESINKNKTTNPLLINIYTVKE